MGHGRFYLPCKPAIYRDPPYYEQETVSKLSSHTNNEHRLYYGTR